MPLYKFYRIVPKDTTQTDCYIGHTIQPLRKRFTAHCLKSNDTTSKALFERYGKDGLEIVLIHELELPDKEYARREERRLWEEIKERAVNQRKPWVSDEEEKTQHYTHQKKYREANKEVISAQNKKYREANKEVILARDKKYREDHKEQQKQYYEANKEQWKQYNKKYREDHKEQQKQYQKAYREAKKATPPPDASLDTPQTQP